jgi:hypothetical protein
VPASITAYARSVFPAMRVPVRAIKISAEHCGEFFPLIPLTLAEQDLIGWYFFPQASSLPAAQPAPRPEASPARYIGVSTASSGLALLAVAALLATGCGSTRGSLDRQLAAAQVEAERTIADSALAAERARVAEIHRGVR